jgi:Zn-dependent metalloprotease
VPRVEFACCRVGLDGDLMVAQLSRAALRLLSRPAARAGRQLVHLHDIRNCSPTHRGGGVHTPGSRHVVRFVP